MSTPSVPARNTSLSPDPARLAAVLVRAWAEVRCGRRPALQLAPLVAPAVLAKLQRSRPHRPSQQPTVRRVTTQQPTPDVCEAVVTLSWAGQRVSAVAIRLERMHGRWQAVDITAPESRSRQVRSPTGHRVTTPRPAAATEPAADQQPAMATRR